MRKVVFYGAISLDGYLADQQDDLQWLFDTDLAGESTYADFEQQVDTFVMGRKTYEETKKIMAGAELYPGQEKVVFTHQALALDKDVTYVSGDVEKIMQEYRQRDGKAIWIIGGGSLLKPLLEADLIDEFWIQIAPVLLGQGKRLFLPGDYGGRLELVETTQMGELTELHLKRKVSGENSCKSN